MRKDDRSGFRAMPRNCHVPTEHMAPVAQLDRAPDFESGGWRFKSFRARTNFARRCQSPALSASGTHRRIVAPHPCGQGNRLKVPGPLHWGIGLPNPSSRACPGDQDKHKLAIPCPYWSPGQALPGSHILGTTFRRLPSARTKTRQAGQMPGQPRSSAVAMPDRPMFGCR